MNRVRLVVGCVLGLALPATALAQSAPPPPLPTDAAHDPGFVIMDRVDGSSRAGAELEYLFPDHTGTSDVTAFRIDAHMQYVSPQSGFGVYGTLPLSHVSGGNESYTPVGDIELGALFAPHQISPSTAFVLHAGITLPTAPSGTGDALSNLIASSARFDDLYLSIPDGLSLRAGGSLLARSGQLFARFDAAVDANLSAANSSSTDTFLRFNAGVGADLGQVALMGELVNLYDSSASSGGSGSSWLNVGALSLRVRANNLQPYVALTFPLDHDSNSFMSAALTVGVDAVLGR